MYQRLALLPSARWIFVIDLGEVRAAESRRSARTSPREGKHRRVHARPLQSTRHRPKPQPGHDLRQRSRRCARRRGRRGDPVRASGGRGPRRGHVGRPVAGRRARAGPGGRRDGRRGRPRGGAPGAHGERGRDGARRRHRAAPRVAVRARAVRGDAPRRGRERDGEGRGRGHPAARRVRGGVRTHRANAPRRVLRARRGGGRGERAGRRRRGAAAHGRQGGVPGMRAPIAERGRERGREVERGALPVELRRRGIRARGDAPKGGVTRSIRAPSLHRIVHEREERVFVYIVTLHYIPS
mmetsp:Transcript_10105/g.40840  ORF Transcript_10105/g.40840 Transcript_10105/m.40840 type:complete len:297 (+) Transcript_10105:5485-6375(+)